MSTDFTTGKNKKITNESTFLMLSNKLGNLFKDYNLDRDFFYDLYKNKNLFDSTLTDKQTRWKLFKRYEDSNAYTDNVFDNVHILNSAIDNDEILDKKDATINERKTIILNNCKSKIDNGICSNFQLTGFFPHLDKPYKILSIESTSGDIPCFEYGFTTIYATLNYSDSCGMEYIEPMPIYNNYTYENNKITNDKLSFNTMTDINLFDKNEMPSFKWEIVENSVDVIVKNNEYNSNTIELATLSSAISPSIELKLIYTE